MRRITYTFQYPLNSSVSTGQHYAHLNHRVQPSVSWNEWNTNTRKTYPRAVCYGLKTQREDFPGGFLAAHFLSSHFGPLRRVIPWMAEIVTEEYPFFPLVRASDRPYEAPFALLSKEKFFEREETAGKSFTDCRRALAGTGCVKYGYNVWDNLRPRESAALAVMLSLSDDSEKSAQRCPLI